MKREDPLKEKTKRFCQNDEIVYFNTGSYVHREDGPARIRFNGYQAWYKNSQLHREGGPAIIWENGNQSYWRNGKRHRENGPAIILANGIKHWYKNGKCIIKNKKKNEKYK